MRKVNNNNAAHRPKITVIVPIYNSEKYLDECLASIEKQTFKDIEILCINDGSKDESQKILIKHKKQDGRIKIINQKNHGIAFTRSIGLKKAMGEYVAWVDSDDIISKNMLYVMYNKAISTNSEVVICDYDTFPYLSKSPKWFKRYEGKVDWRFITNNTIQWNKLVKKSLLDMLNISHLFTELGEGCYSLVLINANKIQTIQKPLYHHRIGHSSLSSSHSNTQWYKTTAKYALNKYKYVRDEGYSEYWVNFFYYIFLRYNLILSLIAARNNDYETFNQARNVVSRNNLFSAKYLEYLQYQYTKSEIIILKIIIRNYNLSRIITKIIIK